MAATGIPGGQQLGCRSVVTCRKAGGPGSKRAARSRSRRGGRAAPRDLGQTAV